MFGPIAHAVATSGSGGGDDDTQIRVHKVNLVANEHELQDPRLAEMFGGGLGLYFYLFICVKNRDMSNVPSNSTCWYSNRQLSRLMGYRQSVIKFEDERNYNRHPLFGHLPPMTWEGDPPTVPFKYTKHTIQTMDVQYIGISNGCRGKDSLYPLQLLIWESERFHICRKGCRVCYIPKMITIIVRSIDTFLRNIGSVTTTSSLPRVIPKRNPKPNNDNKINEASPSLPIIHPPHPPPPPLGSYPPLLSTVTPVEWKVPSLSDISSVPSESKTPIVNNPSPPTIPPPCAREEGNTPSIPILPNTTLSQLTSLPSPRVSMPPPHPRPIMNTTLTAPSSQLTPTSNLLNQVSSSLYPRLPPLVTTTTNNNIPLLPIRNINSSNTAMIPSPPQYQQAVFQYIHPQITNELKSTMESLSALASNTKPQTMYDRSIRSLFEFSVCSCHACLNPSSLFPRPVPLSSNPPTSSSSSSPSSSSVPRVNKRPIVIE